MVSVLRTLQAEWNDLVPLAQARGIRRVRILNAPLETIEYRRNKLEWLKGLLNTAAVVTSVDLSALTFGIEVEFMLPIGMSHAVMARLITNAGIPCTFDGYTHGNIHTWKLVTDGSLGDYSRGAELVSPVLRGEDGFSQVMRATKVLQENGSKISKRCGLHVHVGASDWTVDTFKNLIRLYKSAEDAIDTFMAPSRRGAHAGNGFCKAMRVSESSLEAATTTDGIARAIYQTPGRANARGAGRYYKINMQSFWQHGTVEFRQHQGTVEGTKIVNWTKLCLRMALAAREGTRAAATLDALLDAVKADPSEATYFRARVDFFARQTTRAVRAATRRSDRRNIGDPWAQPASASASVEPNQFEAIGNDLAARSVSRDQL